MELNLKYVPDALKNRPSYVHNYRKYVVLHETGHALGFFHEHQHPIFSADVFERENILDDLRKKFNMKPKKAIKFFDANFGPEMDPGFIYPFDRDSIMRYEYVDTNFLTLNATN